MRSKTFPVLRAKNRRTREALSPTPQHGGPPPPAPPKTLKHSLISTCARRQTAAGATQRATPGTCRSTPGTGQAGRRGGGLRWGPWWCRCLHTWIRDSRIRGTMEVGLAVLGQADVGQPGRGGVTWSAWAGRHHSPPAGEDSTCTLEKRDAILWPKTLKMTK